VKATLRLARRTTYADYLAAEDTSERRHELIDGVIVAMAGGSDEHNALSAKLGALAVARVTGDRRVYSPDQRFWIAATARARYGDGSIICGKPQHPTHDDQATTNPSVIVEVLSPSSEGDDEGDKRVDFQSLTSLRAYILVAQDARRVTVFRRGENGAWHTDPDLYLDGQSFELPTLSRPIAVAELYDGILDADGRSLLR
jgi:Uma2 family endonuclease